MDRKLSRETVAIPTAGIVDRISQELAQSPPQPSHPARA
jgi:hypothetical protein